MSGKRLTQFELETWIRGLIAANKLHEFYTSSVWLRLRAEVLHEDKNECQHCKARGFYKKADTVHHVQFLKKYPELALSKFYEFAGKIYRNLISLCHACHEEAHSFRKPEAKLLTEERW